MSRRTPTPLGVLACGALAGAAGTGAMTAWQTLSAKLERTEESDSRAEQPDARPEALWEQAPAPAKVAKRIGEGVFGQELSPDLIPALTNAMHWAYGTGWGALYGLAVAGRLGARTRRGAIFGTLVWASSYVEMVPMGIYELPWKYEPKELALDLSYHLVYGIGTAFAFDALQR